MFSNLNYLNRQRLDNSSYILKNILLIDTKDAAKEIKGFAEKDIESLWWQFHNISMKYLQNYSIKLEHYFPSIQNHPDFQHYSLTLNSILYSYLVKNIQQNLYFSTTNNANISFKKSIVNYYAKYKSLNDIQNEDTLNSIVPNYRTKFKSFRNSNCNILAINSVFYNNLINPIKNNPYEIFQNTSNLFIYTLDNWNKCKYNFKKKNTKDSYYNLDEIINYKYDYGCCNFKSLKDFSENFLVQDIRLIDLYFFERIYNIQFTLCTYFSPKLYIDNLAVEEEWLLLKGLLPIMYLPNVFENYNFINFFIDIYKNLYKYYNINEFKEGIKNFCLDLSLYFIPLYDMIYTNFIDIYCNVNNLDLCLFINNKLNNLDQLLEDYKKNYFLYLNKAQFDKSINNKPKLLKYSKIQKDPYFNDLSFTITACFDFKLLERVNILENFFNFKENIISSVVIDVNKYQRTLKEFMLNILNNSSIDLFHLNMDR